MRALKLIIEREYMATVKTKAFLLTTIITPIAMILVMGLPSILMSIKDSDIEKIYVMDETRMYANLFQSGEEYQFIPLEGTNKTMADFKSEGESMYALLQISGDLSENPQAATFISEKQKPPRELISYINDKLTEAVKQKKLDNYTSQINIEPQVVSNLQEILGSKDHIQVTTLRLGEDGKDTDTVSEATSMLGLAFTFFMFFFIIMFGSMVMQSVTEEKTNRIVEVIVSSTKPFNLMMGKIIAVALTGITQLLIWAVIITAAMTVVFSVTGIGSLEALQSADMQQLTSMMGGSEQLAAFTKGAIQVNWIQIFVCFILYFIGGYLIYASLFAMFGSAANDSQEAQQFIMPVTIILLLAFYVGFASTNNPEGSLAFWGSIIPFTSPIVMMVRAPFDIPIWELVVSIVLLYVTAILCIYLAGKIYRTGILMYGKKTTFKELFKWLKYK
jgi:ABC-2 type transport system permease protein